MWVAALSKPYSYATLANCRADKSVAIFEVSKSKQSSLKPSASYVKKGNCVVYVAKSLYATALYLQQIPSDGK